MKEQKDLRYRFTIDQVVTVRPTAPDGTWHRAHNSSFTGECRPGSTGRITDLRPNLRGGEATVIWTDHPTGFTRTPGGSSTIDLECLISTEEPTEEEILRLFGLAPVPHCTTCTCQEGSST